MPDGRDDRDSHQAEERQPEQQQAPPVQQHGAEHDRGQREVASAGEAQGGDDRADDHHRRAVLRVVAGLPQRLLTSVRARPDAHHDAGSAPIVRRAPSSRQTSPAGDDVRQSSSRFVSGGPTCSIPRPVAFVFEGDQATGW